MGPCSSGGVAARLAGLDVRDFRGEITNGYLAHQLAVSRGDEVNFYLVSERRITARIENVAAIKRAGNGEVDFFGVVPTLWIFGSKG